MLPDDVERHDGRDLAVKRQLVAELQQSDQVAVGDRHRLLRMRHVRLVVDVRQLRAAQHGRVPARRRLRVLVRAYAHVLQVVVARGFETAGQSADLCNFVFLETVRESMTVVVVGVVVKTMGEKGGGGELRRKSRLSEGVDHRKDSSADACLGLAWDTDASTKSTPNWS